MLAIVLSSIFTSLAGSLYAHYLIVAAPDVFSFSLTTFLLSMVLVGGASSIYGPAIAAIVLTVGTEKLAGLGVVRYMVIAVLIVLTLRFLPGGVASLGRIGMERYRGRHAPLRLRFCLKERSHMTLMPWPEGYYAAASFTFDFDAETVWVALDPANAHRPACFRSDLMARAWACI